MPNSLNESKILLQMGKVLNAKQQFKFLANRLRAEQSVLSNGWDAVELSARKQELTELVVSFEKHYKKMKHEFHELNPSGAQCAELDAQLKQLKKLN